MKIICLGDSLTFGYGVYKNDRWVELIKKEININIINKGINGDTTSNMLNRLYEEVIREKPNIVIFMGGSNDFMMGIPLKNIKDNFIYSIKELKDNNIFTIVIVQPPMMKKLARERWDSFINYDNVNRTIVSYKEFIEENEEKFGYKILNFYSIINKSKDKDQYYLDGVHLNKKGNELLKNLLIEKLKETAILNF